MIRPFKLKLNSDLVGLFFISLTWLLFFGRVISGKYVYFLDDLKILYYPLEVAYSAFQHAGQLPLWSPHFGFGQPLLAWGQLGFFTPLHLALRALYVSPINLLQISVAAYFALGVFGFYALLRQHRLSALAAALGAVVYIFSGFNIGHLNHVNFYVGTMVLPWLLVAVTAFLRQPTLPRAATMGLVAAIIALSSQPQITLYIFLIAAVYGITALFFSLPASKLRYLVKATTFTVTGAILALLLSSLAILPLTEFLPETDRSADLPIEELLDFSYPPSHAITLIAPYFFGDHTSYWGAKGFQELAAFTGILPLLLSGLALTQWREWRHLRLTGIVLIVISLVMALGQYSPLYSYLVTSYILTNLNIPGRFVFFFTTGIAILSAVGLNDLLRSRLGSSHQVVAAIVPVLVLTAVLAPFAWRLSETTIAAHVIELFTQADPALLLAALGLIMYYLVLYLLPRTAHRGLIGVFLHLVAGGTLLVFGYNYTPIATRDSFNNSLPFVEPLAAYSQSMGLPARLYSHDILLDDLPYHKVVATQPLSPHYTVFQPITVTNPAQSCFIIPMQAATGAGAIQISLLPSLQSPPADTVTIKAYKIVSRLEQRVCFSTVLPASPTEAVLRFSSQTDTTVRLAIYPTQGLSAYLVRTPNPTAEIIAASQKPHRIDLIEDLSSYYDSEVLLLARHLQVVGNASSARWVGALALRPYRDFIEEFLANDEEKPFTSDGEHIITTNRSIVNMLGITHLAQRLPPESQDRMAESGYRTVAETKAGLSIYRLYENPAAFPKAWLVQTAAFISSADETRHAIKDPAFKPENKVYLSGPKPPSATELATQPPHPNDEAGLVRITSYQPTQVTLAVATPRDTWLVMSDTTTPQWHTFVDQRPAPYYVANSFMKAAFVPAGQHTVSFVYHSPATRQAAILTVVGLGLLLACYLIPLALHYLRRSSRSQVGVPPQTS